MRRLLVSLALWSGASIACDYGATSDRGLTPSMTPTGGARANDAGASGVSGAQPGSTTMLTLIKPIDRGTGRLVLEFGATYFEVDPSHGARITSLRQAGQELLTLTGASNYADAFGSTFWPSPQSWPWPPPAEIDNLAYVATIDPSGGIALVGQANEATGLQVEKRFRANLARETLELEYAMTNTSSAAVAWAPWEITRLPATGLAFWPTGGEPFGERPLAHEGMFGLSFCEPAKTEGEAKLFADGAGGYLAYLLGDRLLIKQFTDQPASAAAPGEAEIELYVNPGHDYLELENQGAYTSIAPGETVTWKLSWYVRQVPPEVAGAGASEDLVAFVTKTLE